MNWGEILNKCLLCGNESFSSEDNVCQRCIDDFIKIDKSTLPKWLLGVEQRRSLDIVLSQVLKRGLDSLAPFGPSL